MKSIILIVFLAFVVAGICIRVYSRSSHWKLTSTENLSVDAFVAEFNTKQFDGEKFRTMVRFSDGFVFQAFDTQYEKADRGKTRMFVTRFMKEDVLIRAIDKHGEIISGLSSRTDGKGFLSGLTRKSKHDELSFRVPSHRTFKDGYERIQPPFRQRIFYGEYERIEPVFKKMAYELKKEGLDDAFFCTLIFVNVQLLTVTARIQPYDVKTFLKARCCVESDSFPGISEKCVDSMVDIALGYIFGNDPAFYQGQSQYIR